MIQPLRPVSSFYGHGKLLITSEYFVLDGAKALAVPTKFGQQMRVTQLQATDNILYWVALNSKKHPWLNLVFDTTTFNCLNSTGEEANRLSHILKETRNLNVEFLRDGKNYAVETHLEFPNEWGLGSSSTLIHCVAKWANVDGYNLLKNTIGGSGYDVSCAAHNTAILYQLKKGTPETLNTLWKPPFTSGLYFVYTGKKQLSSAGIKYYREKLQNKTDTINQLNALTESILKCSELDLFEALLREHENTIGSALKMIKVQETMFANYWGVVKSLGAWGGDFVMLTNNRTEEELKHYLFGKNLTTIFSWNDLIL